MLRRFIKNQRKRGCTLIDSNLEWTWPVPDRQAVPYTRDITANCFVRGMQNKHVFYLQACCRRVLQIQPHGDDFVMIPGHEPEWVLLELIQDIYKA